MTQEHDGRPARSNGTKSLRSRTTASGTKDKTKVKGLIVGIGASAGGLGAFTSFLANMPVDSGMAFILIQHLSPDHKSILTDLLAKVTSMPVIEAVDGMPVDPNHVFVIPPNCTLTVKDRRISISRPAPPRERRRPIDTFFFSLAEDQGENAICIVLSGTGTDGSLGLKTVKESGGLTIAQAEIDHTAMSGMPHSAASTGLVGLYLPSFLNTGTIFEKSRTTRMVTASAMTRVNIWPRLLPFCVSRPIKISANTRKQLSRVASNAGCRCSRSPRCPPISSVCGMTRKKQSCYSASC